MLRCAPCGKTFTGQECYGQHVKSDKHKRKILSLGLLNKENEASDNVTNTVATTDIKCEKIKCTVCDISFHSFESFQSHSETPAHALKIMLKSTQGNTNSNLVSSPSSASSNHGFNEMKDEAKSAIEDEMLLPGFDDDKNFILSCDVCMKTFSGPEPYRQHLESANHRKKVELQKQSPITGITQNASTFSCEPCKKLFSGQVPYIQHMTSDTHKKKMQQIQYVQNHFAQSNSSSRMEENVLKITESDCTNPWFCKICNVQCSGLVPYEQHISGSTHFKNANRAKLMQNGFISDSVKPAVQVGNYEENRVPEISATPSQLVNASNQKDNQKIENDYILPDMFDAKLNIMSTDELEAAIKVFHPDETIDFDKSESKIETNSENKSASQDNSVQNLNTAEKKSYVYQECNFCNVKLFNKDEAAHHFESIEHVRKRWGRDSILQIVKD